MASIDGKSLKFDSRLLMRSGKVDEEPYHSIFVGNIEPWFDAEFVASLFPEARPDAVQMRFNKNNTPAGFAFALYSSEADASACLSTYRGKAGRIIRDGFEAQRFAYKINRGRTPISRYAPNIVLTSALPNQPVQIELADSPRSPRTARETVGALYVGDLAAEITDAELLVHLQARFPSAREARIVRHPMSGMSRKYGFVAFSDADEMAAAVEKLAGVALGSAVPRVLPAQHQNYSLRPGPAPLPSATDIAKAIVANGGIDGVSPFAAAAPNTTVYFGGLPPGTSETDLYARLTPEFGTLARIRVIPPRACAFVTFATRSAALLCVQRYAPRRRDGSLVGTRAPRDPITAAGVAADAAVRDTAARCGVSLAQCTASAVVFGRDPEPLAQRSPLDGSSRPEDNPPPFRYGQLSKAEATLCVPGGQLGAPFPNLQAVRSSGSAHADAIFNTIMAAATAAAESALRDTAAAPVGESAEEGSLTYPFTILAGGPGLRVSWGSRAAIPLSPRTARTPGVSQPSSARGPSSGARGSFSASTSASVSSASTPASLAPAHATVSSIQIPLPHVVQTQNVQAISPGPGHELPLCPIPEGTPAPPLSDMRRRSTPGPSSSSMGGVGEFTGVVPPFTVRSASPVAPQWYPPVHPGVQPRLSLPEDSMSSGIGLFPPGPVYPGRFCNSMGPSMYDYCTQGAWNGQRRSSLPVGIPRQSVGAVPALPPAASTGHPGWAFFGSDLSGDSPFVPPASPSSLSQNLPAAGSTHASYTQMGYTSQI